MGVTEVVSPSKQLAFSHCLHRVLQLCLSVNTHASPVYRVTEHIRFSEMVLPNLGFSLVDATHDSSLHETSAQPVLHSQCYASFGSKSFEFQIHIVYFK